MLLGLKAYFRLVETIGVMVQRLLSVCVVTTSRADYGLLREPMRLMRESDKFELQVIATGSHLSADLGSSYKEIETDGFALDAKIQIIVDGDTGLAAVKSLGLATTGFADAFDRLRPDFVVILGDRYEILAPAEAALLMQIPVAHISGGDNTHGAFDDAIRHAVTKLSHLHFVTNSVAARRLHQLGEDPGRIHNVGNPGLDCLKTIEPMSKHDALKAVGLRDLETNFLVAFHPETLRLNESHNHAFELCAALDSIEYEAGFVITGSNIDPGARRLTEIMRDFALRKTNAVHIENLGTPLYLNLLRHADLIIGNSSSGLIEAPSVATPTVNLGDRQAGRVKADSVIDCEIERGAIVEAIKSALELDCSSVVNPYGDGHSAPRIIKILESIECPQTLLRKPPFVDLTWT